MNAHELRNLARAVIGARTNDQTQVDDILADVLAKAEKAARKGEFSVAIMWVVIDPCESAVIERLNALGFITKNHGQEFIVQW